MRKEKTSTQAGVQARVRDWVGARGYGTLNLETAFETSYASFNYGQRIPTYRLFLKDISFVGAHINQIEFFGRSVDDVAQKAWDFIVRNGGDK